MKKPLMIAALALLTAVGAIAQDKQPKTPQERAAAQTERMVKELELSPDQATKLGALNLKYAEQAEVMRQQEVADRGAKKAKGKEMRDARDADMKGLLSSEQYAKWQTQRDAAKEKHKEKRKAERGDMREQQKQ